MALGGAGSGHDAVKVYKKSVVLNGVRLDVGLPVGADTFRGLDLTQWTDFSWADELCWVIDLQAESGVTAGALSAKFQVGIPHKTGAYQWASQRLADWVAADYTGRTAEGAQWGAAGVLWTHGSTTLPVTTQRTVIRPGPRCNLRLFFSTPITGGGYIQVSVTLVQRGT